MKKGQKRRSRPGGGGSGKSQRAAAHGPDSTLVKLLVNYMALPTGAVRMSTDSEGRTVALLTPDATLYHNAIQARAAQLGGFPALQRAMDAIVGGPV